MSDAANVTLVSIVPVPVSVPQPHIVPSYYAVKPAEKGSPETLVIGEAYHYVYMGDGKQLRQTAPAYEVAEAIVNQYRKSQLCISEEPEPAYPGLFWVQGRLTKEEVKKKHEAELASAKILQDRWFMNLISEGDDVWMKFQQHKMITPLQRVAAKLMNQDKPWMLVSKEMAQQCPACGSLLASPTAFLCANCKWVVNPAAAKAAGYAVAVGA